jgi:hypothetical protein
MTKKAKAFRTRLARAKKRGSGVFFLWETEKQNKPPPFF